MHTQQLWDALETILAEIEEVDEVVRRALVKQETLHAARTSLERLRSHARHVVLPPWSATDVGLVCFHGA